VYTQDYDPRCYLFSFTAQKPVTENFVEAREVDQDRNFNVEAKEAGEELKPPFCRSSQRLIPEMGFN
jgi:hypothetical protein